MEKGEKIKFFQEIIDYNIQHAKNVWKDKKELMPLMVAFGPSGIGLIPFVYPDGGKGRFLSAIHQKLKEEKVEVLSVIAETWAATGKGDEEQAELQAFTDAGGSLEFWPGKVELLVCEMCDGEHYQSDNYTMIRDESGTVTDIVYDEIRSIPFQDLTDEGKMVQSNVIRLMTL